MKVEINFDTKEIILKSQVTFSDLNKLKKMLGEDYNTFNLISEVQIVRDVVEVEKPSPFWLQPHVIPYQPYYENPFTITCGTEGASNTQVTPGTSYTTIIN